MFSNLFEKLQSILLPMEFGLLFSLMLLYWVQMAFFSYTKYNQLNLFVFYMSFFVSTSILGLRWIESRHFPLSNLYESLLFLSWSFLVSKLILQFQWRDNIQPPKLNFINKGKANVTEHKANVTENNNSIASPEYTFLATSTTGTPFLAKTIIEKDKTKEEKVQTLQSHLYSLQDILGVVISPLAFVSYGFAFFYLPKEMQKATALVPALQSNWLMMHVTVMILSYAALLCGSILSMAFLLVHFLNPTVEPSDLVDVLKPNVNTPKKSVPVKQVDLINVNTLLKDTNQIEQKNFISQLTNSSKYLTLCDLFDNLSYRFIGLGFPLLTIGILSGAVWANQAWGAYWSWDPKETWALVTWFVFAVYLHARITKGLKGKNAAFIATAGFFVVWFCYLGVNLIGSGLHSYGFFSKNY